MAAERGFLDAQVSEAFVEKYYRLVGTKTHAVHQFYADGSIVTRPGPDGTVMSFSSLEAIEKHYLSSYYDGFTFNVLSVDSQSSLGDGLFIMVVGFLTGKDNLKRKFSQAFYLARQTGGYVVVNDIQRFVGEERSTPRSLPSEVAKPVEEVKKTKQVKKATKKKSVGAAEVKKVVAVATPLEKVVTAQKPKEPVAETSATPCLDGASKSFASMVLSMSRNPAPVQVKAAPVQNPSSVAQPKPNVAPEPVKKSEHKMVDEPGTSIFVSNLPMDARWSQVSELFKGFGPIKEHGVQIRHSRDSGRCFAFVAFESVASVQSVLKAAKSNQFKLGDHKLRVREKQVEFYGSKPSGGISEGRSMSQSGSVDGSKTENGSEAGLEEDGDGFTLFISRRKRKENRRQ
ncbi:Nuclear transport factor 2 (NTF2) family protein with RNA binding (RRM-RBD-RNP motifs) domain [Raphanus sativus]|uniref:Nuclear transport factor 2 n=1 Tax=Raphanus sativus TaxID=3726 RepID=A0A6J0KC38_RAPSA|nr:nuclear transport factor 2 [Raphanus sativus]KAJ4884243.1 Nuclear transport factor 2 (NTF2) family protein with RNA binding (RRM-RBD-RNP motifs) domain [Raphanus sativus]